MMNPALHRSLRFAALILVAAAGAPDPLRPLSVSDTLSTYAREHYTRQDVMIPMRDGKRLFTTIYAPRDTNQRYPILLTRTPYATDTYIRPLGPSEAFTRDGYIFVFQDVRGRYQSEGDFVQVRPFNPSKSGTEIDEASDTYDTIEWLIHGVPHNNGRVGQYGISYLGFYSTMGILSAHPALKAVSPQAPVTNWFVGDDFHHNGVFFLADAFDFLSGFGVPRPAPTTRHEPSFPHGTPDSYDFFLRLGALPNANANALKGKIPYWNELMQHSSYDAWWKATVPLQHLKHVKPAVMTVGGWFDAEDLWGALHVFQAIERQSPEAHNSLVMGPWFHGGWFLSNGSAFGDLRFGDQTSEYYHEKIELPFFNHYLKDAPDPHLPKASVYETGTNRWRTFDRWPPPGTATVSYFFQDRGRLATTPPAAARTRFDEYVSDPAHPVPYVPGIVDERPAEYMAADQRFVWGRPDVLSYETSALETDVTLAGPIRAKLFVSTTGTDADWVVKVIDVYPNDTPDPSPNPSGVHLGGYQQLVRAEIMRGKFRNTFERPEPFVPGQATKVEFELPDAMHTFKRGHRIMVQVQSSWFPLADRNPQRFEDIYHAKDSDFVKATHRVYRTGPLASQVQLTVLR